MKGNLMSGSENTPMLFEALSSARPLYILPKDPVSKEVLIPALKVAKKLDVMMGYFSSGSFVEVAPGLSTFLKENNSAIRLIVSPYLTERDYEALVCSPKEWSKLAQKLFIDEVPSEDALVNHTFECLAWLIYQERLEIKIAVMRKALFHPKVWLLDDNVNQVALHGSTNFTAAGLARNYEQLTLSRGWIGEEARYHIERLSEEFVTLWEGGEGDCLVMPFDKAVGQKLVERYKNSTTPSEDDFERQWLKAEGALTAESGQSTPQLSVPSYLNYKSGEFSHQGEAVSAWLSSDCHGILEMATGSGKTITSMICSTKLQDLVGKLLIVISAPYKPLIGQWCEEIEEFGIKAINIGDLGGAKQRGRKIKQIGRRLRMGLSRTEVIVVSNDTLCTHDFINDLSDIQAHKLHIADECHNLGAARFSKNPPSIFDSHLGLSATPIRQYDEEGTSSIVKYFGGICFSYTLKEAIGKCLTEYDYYPHIIELTDSEMDEWTELSEKISAQSWRVNSDSSDPYIEKLLRDRRLVLEVAEGKLSVLEILLKELGPRKIRYGLIYATDKDPNQLARVNELLGRHGVLYRQLTYEETKNKKTVSEILSNFQKGRLQILTAKRVLDEGVNIPQINTAFILASTTVERQWIQRRGRLLRTCHAIGKTHAVIHDFVVLPPGTSGEKIKSLDKDARKLIRSELNRVWEFAQLSRNATDPGGPYDVVKKLQSLANEME